MKSETALSLRRAAENRDLARSILDSHDQTSVPLRWGAVIASHAAVQYVNAVLNEHLTVPHKHAEREATTELLRELRSVLPQSIALNQLG